MAKPGFRTTHLINGKEPLLRRIVCEVRYRDGHLYLDHCGRLTRELVNLPGCVQIDATTGGASILKLSLGGLLTFSSSAVSFQVDRANTDDIIEPNEVAEFASFASTAFDCVFDQLEIREYARIGYRELYYFPSEDKEDAEAWLLGAGENVASASLARAFGGTIEQLAFTTSIAGSDMSYRIGLAGVERAAQIPVGDNNISVRSSALPSNQRSALKESLKIKRHRQINTAFSVVLDVDAFVDDPQEIAVKGLVTECNSTNLDRFRLAYTSKGIEKQEKSRGQ